MVRADAGGHIPASYGEFVEVFSHDMAETLPPHQSINHAIDLEPGCNLPSEHIYNLLELELRTLEADIEANLANGILQ
jgi:hypothetical protein